MTFFPYFSAADVVSSLEMGRTEEESSKDTSGLLERALGIVQLSRSSWRQLQRAQTSARSASRPAVGQRAGEEHRINEALVAIDTSLDLCGEDINSSYSSWSVRLAQYLQDTLTLFTWV